jgi:hypothetical protein
MSRYQVYNGSEWVDICRCNFNVRTSGNTWQNVNPNNCPVRYWTGDDWCEVTCQLLCGDFAGAILTGRKVGYMPFTIPAGVYSIIVTVSPSQLPDGFSIIDAAKTTKLASTGFIGSNSISGWWNTGTGPESLPAFTYDYSLNDFVDDGVNENISYYDSSSGGNPMSNTNPFTMYNRALDSNITLQPDIVGNEPAAVCNDAYAAMGYGFDANVGKYCTSMVYNRPDPTITEGILIQGIPGMAGGTGWIVANIACIYEPTP